VVDKPSGVVTFLFTDIEGSTRLWESDADSMRRALTGHDDIMRKIVAAHDGWLFKHSGDGICAAFGSPKYAVDAAIAAQRAVELPIRMGVATGEADLRDNDYFGTVLNRTARVMSAGHGGQILVDGITADLLTGVDLLAMGQQRLRDIARPVEVFQVRAEDLRFEFPPLKTADSTPGNLRTPLTRLIGRESELSEVVRRAAPDFLDGVWVVELAAVTDPAAVPDAVAGVLGITQQPVMTLTDSIAAALEGRSRLLLFDNCEHVLNATADIVEAILTRSATVTILATSREGLRVADEQRWPVPSLDTDGGSASAAATLFAERAESAGPGVALQADAVQEICRRLDGIPLAIELAASRMVSMTVTEVRDRLNDRFRLLVGSRRGLERHQTLRHAVQWSYDLLSQEEQQLLNRCSVFAGGFELAGAYALFGSDDEFATVDLLDALVRKSLLVVERSSGRTRFSMLETIRQFAEDQLAAEGVGESTRDAHARFFADREAVVVALWDGPRQREAYDWFTTELPNVRAAFRWAADRGDLDCAAAIVTYSFIGPLAELYEPIAWAEEIIDAAESARHRRLMCLYMSAAHCCWLGHTESALRFSENGLRLIDDHRYDPSPFDWEAGLGSVYITTGQPDLWADASRRVLEHRSDEHGHARASLAMALAFAGATEDARTLTDGLVDVAIASHNPHSLSQALIAVGIAFRDIDPAIALDSFRRSLQVTLDSGNRFHLSHTAVVLAALEAEHGSKEAALDDLAVAIRNYLDSGNIGTSRSPLAVLTTLLNRLGQHDEAASIAGFAADPFARMAVPEIVATVEQLRETLGDQRYESLAQAGSAMTNAQMANYALEQIDLARTRLR
jgi:predicted ATPase